MKTLVLHVLIVSLVASQIAIAQTPSAERNVYPLYIKIQLDRSVRLSSLKPGEVTEGNLARDVYSADGKVFAAGSHVRLSVDHLERRRRVANDHWPWVVKVFMPRHENYPFFKDAIVSAPEGAESPLQVSLISVSRRIELQPQKKKKQLPKNDASMSAIATVDVATTDASAPPTQLSGPEIPARDNAERERSKPAVGPIMSLEARAVGNEISAGDTVTPPLPSTGVVTLPSGTTCRILLLGGLSASKSHAGNLVRARLLEPLVRDSRVVMPAGSVFEGKVTRAVAPRWASRAGSLSLTFTSVTLPDGSRIPIAASLTRIELNRGSHTKMDAEGGLRGDRPGAVWMLINGGMTAGIAKEIDDGTQLVMEAILSGATDASTAGTARIAGSVVSSIFMLTRHGRDVVLPNLTEMNITLTRPLLLSGSLLPASAINERESGVVIPPAVPSH